MTFRAIVIALLLGAAIAALGYFSDWVLKLTFVASDLLPVGAFGLLLAGLLLINPLLRFFRVRPLAAAEMALIVALLLVVCVIPGPGLMWNFLNALIMPHHYVQTDLQWQRQQLIERLPPMMLADVSRDGRDLIGFTSGLGMNRSISPAEVPWHAWTRTLSFWLPLIGLSFVAGIGLMLALHRHWSRHEHLRYPVAAFASELLREADRGYWPAVFHNRRFWIGFAVAAGVLGLNGVALWHPGGVQIPLSLDLRPMVQKWPVLGELPFPLGEILAPRFFFAAVGLAFFVSSDVSLSVGLSTIVYAALYLVLTWGGVRLGGDYFGTGGQNFLLVGAYVGMAMVVFYIGRRFYLSLLAGAVGFRMAGRGGRETLWPFRLALAAAAAMVVLLKCVGLDLLPACLLVGLLGVMFLVLTRVTVETGLFFIQPTWQVAPVIAAMLGWSAVGPKAMLIVGLVSLVLAIDPRVCLMPMVANALQIGQDQGLRPPRLAAWMAPALLLALAAGVAGTLYVQYNYGSNMLYDWANAAARQPFDLVSRNFASFAVSPAGAGAGGGAATLGAFNPDIRLLSCAGAGLALVIACGLLRLRLAWWPIHPVLFLVWGTLSSAWYGPSFLLGWLLKSCVVKFGGSKSYQAAKPLFVGLVAGEFAAALLWACVGLVYYLKTGIAAPTFRTHL
jgi:hypothetical protein